MENIKNKSSTFNKLDVVELKEKYKNYSITYKKIVGKRLVVEKAYFASLGDMEVEVLYLNIVDGVENPYLAEHFELIKS